MISIEKSAWPTTGNLPASLGRILSMPRTVPRSEWIHVCLTLVEAVDGFKDFRPG
jgi:hypothetical protein